MTIMLSLDFDDISKIDRNLGDFEIKKILCILEKNKQNSISFTKLQGIISNVRCERNRLKNLIDQLNDMISSKDFDYLKDFPDVFSVEDRIKISNYFGSIPVYSVKKI